MKTILAIIISLLTSGCANLTPEGNALLIRTAGKIITTSLK